MRKTNLKVKNSSSDAKQVRVAIYTRKSTEEGLDQEFNTLDAQRQAIDSYVESQRGEGWFALPEHYDDGGFSGANTDRPAFQRLLQDIEAGRIDAVGVYKIDRLSRSLVDFSKIIDFFDKHNVAFISITQQFNTASSMGKLTLNILMSFAEFERQVIAERTSDKMSAARRKGMWTGGRPMLGYDVRAKKLIINKEEAIQVKQIYKLYLELGSITAVITELNHRGWKNKTYKSKDKKVTPGRPFCKASLKRILSSPLYIGKVLFDGEIFKGAHKAIVDKKTWEAVNAQLDDNRRNSGAGQKNKWNALLREIVFCGACGAVLTHHYTKRRGKIYSYYVCSYALRHGASTCPRSRISAKELEKFVIEQIKEIGGNPALLSQTMDAIRTEVNEKKPELKAELKRLEKEASDLNQQRKNILDTIAQGGNGTAALKDRLDEIDQELIKASKLAQEANKALDDIKSHNIDKNDLQAALSSFTPIWDVLFPREKERIIRLLIEKITVHAQEGEIEITFYPGGIKELASEINEEAAA